MKGACTVCFCVFAMLVSRELHAFVWPNAATRIERQLSSEVTTERRQAAAQLSRLPRPMAARLVPKALADADTEVRLAGVDAALELRLEGAGELVVPWLNDPERKVRMAAIELLTVNPSPNAIAPLGRVLSDPDPIVRAGAAGALGASRSEDAVMHLLGHLDDAMPRVRVAIARALSRLFDARAVVPLIGKVQDSHPSVRASVARALGSLGDARAAPALVLALRDNDEEVRIAAAAALGALHDDSATLSLLSVVRQDTSHEVRQAALVALGDVGSPRALEALVEYLGSDYEGQIRRSAAEALARLGNAALPALGRCVKGELDEVRANGCAGVLGSIGEPSTAPTLVEALRAERVDPTVALEALGKIGARTGLPAALEYLSAPDARVRRRAIEASMELLDPKSPDGRAVEPIRAALSAPTLLMSERVLLVGLLGRTGSRRALEPLSLIARQADETILRRAALEALGLLGAVGQTNVLLSALDEPEPALRFAAALALRQSADPRAAGPLLKRLSEAAEQDRTALLLALTGAVRHAGDPKIVAEIDSLIDRSHGGVRDALIEVLAAADGAAASAALEALLTRANSLEDRAKVAEGLASHAKARGKLLELAHDVDGSVRANAIWSLGSVAERSDAPRLAEALTDRDVAVAGNAAAALGRLFVRTSASVDGPLCKALGDRRSYVRANALAALRLAKRRCQSTVALDLLRADPSALVRARAAALVVNVPGKDAVLERRALDECVAADTDGSVARACKAGPELLGKDSEPVTVIVVPSGETAPVARAPFSLFFADHLMRLGVSDRRGAVYEAFAPDGELSLLNPAPLVD